MKDISVSDRFEFYFPHSSSCTLLADIDDDSNEEIIAASRDGFLFIYHYGEQKPYCASSDLGLVTCMAAGDILNRRRTTLCTISADGSLYLFHISPLSQDYNFIPTFSQKIQSNVRAVFIADIDEDGQQELLLGLSDRIVRSYRFFVQQKEKDTFGGYFIALNKWELPLQITGVSLKCSWSDLKINLNHRSSPACPPRLLASQPGGQYVIITPSSAAKEDSVVRPANDTGAKFTNIFYHASALATTVSKRSLCDALFLYYESSSTFMFHSFSDIVILLAYEEPIQQEIAIIFPAPLLGLAIFGKVVDPYRILCGCDCSGNVYFTKVSNRPILHQQSLSPRHDLPPESVFLRVRLHSPVKTFAAYELHNMRFLLLCSKSDGGLMAFWVDISKHV